ncbi:MAG: acyltransferase [Bacteroidetes bacterium]|nr:acyltransferase [Bacteroidota bacterium]
MSTETPAIPKKSSERIFFPGLDGLRFIAAGLVILFHVEWKRSWFGHINYLDINFFHTVGYFGVTLFFVLSGFLITYLILKEQEKEKTVNVLHFYIRRVLRIWPLYFFIILTGFFLWPNLPIFEIPGYSDLWEFLNWKTFILYSVFLSSVVFVQYGNIPYLDQTWSVSVEEQFYLIWPILVKFFHKKLIRVLFFVILLLLIIKIALLFIYAYTANLYKVLTLVELSRFGCMATGGIAAYVYFKNKTGILDFLLRRDLFWLTFVFILFLLIAGFSVLIVVPFLVAYAVLIYSWLRKTNPKIAGIPLIIIAILALVLTAHLSGNLNYPVFTKFQHEIISFPFALVILQVSVKKEKFQLLQHAVMQYLGRISYGIYMYHNLMITLSIRAMHEIMPNQDSFLAHMLNYLIAFLFAIICSAVSYKLLETPFLHMKKRFAKVKSGAKD